MNMNVEGRPLKYINNMLIQIVTKHVFFFSKRCPGPRGTHARALRRAILGISSTIFVSAFLKMPNINKETCLQISDVRSGMATYSISRPGPRRRRLYIHIYIYIYSMEEARSPTDHSFLQGYVFRSSRVQPNIYAVCSRLNEHIGPFLGSDPNTYKT